MRGIADAPRSQLEPDAEGAVGQTSATSDPHRGHGGSSLIPTGWPFSRIPTVDGTPLDDRRRPAPRALPGTARSVIGLMAAAPGGYMRQRSDRLVEQPDLGRVFWWWCWPVCDQDRVRRGSVVPAPVVCHTVLAAACPAWLVAHEKRTKTRSRLSRLRR